MSESLSLTALLQQAQYRSRWFDLGRRLRTVPQSTVEAFESGNIAWPSPYLRHAWIGLLLWPQEGGESAVWFLRFPLDEQGKLQFAVRDGFIRRLTEALSKDGDAAQQLGRALDDSGLVYAPAPDRRATFHAHAGMILRRLPSEHYQRVLQFLQSPQNGQWEQLGLQGIADVAARWEEHAALLCTALTTVPAPVFNNLCHCLESERIDHRLAGAILDRAKACLEGDAVDPALIAAAVRGVSLSVAEGLRRNFLLEILKRPLRNEVEVLAAIGSRCPEDLLDETLASAWLNALADTGDQNTFNLMLADLMFIPANRDRLLGILRDPQRPEQLATIFGNFLRGSGPTH